MNRRGIILEAIEIRESFAFAFPSESDKNLQPPYYNSHYALTDLSKCFSTQKEIFMWQSKLSGILPGSRKVAYAITSIMFIDILSVTLREEMKKWDLITRAWGANAPIKLVREDNAQIEPLYYN